MSMHHPVFRAALCASLSLPLLFAAGCSDDGTVTSNPNAIALAKGNWQISSAAPAAAKLSVVSGEFTTQAGKITGIFHTQSASACVAPNASFTLAGTADDKNNVTLTGPVSDGTLTVTGTIAADGKSLTNAAYNVAGGSCAFAQKAQATAQAFAAITGNYTGNFADADGNIAQVTANFSQSTTPDANGNFTLGGSASITLPGSPTNPCFPSTLTLTNTQVTGNTFTYTLTPANTTNANGNSVVASGTFSADGSTLTVTNWSSSGTCGTDIGKQSTMTRQGV